MVVQVAAVVTQPGRPKGRGSRRVPQSSPVAQLAASTGFDSSAILSPTSAREASLACTCPVGHVGVQRNC